MRGGQLVKSLDLKSCSSLTASEAFFRCGSLASLSKLLAWHQRGKNTERPNQWIRMKTTQWLSKIQLSLLIKSSRVSAGVVQTNSLGWLAPRHFRTIRSVFWLALNSNWISGCSGSGHNQPLLCQPCQPATSLLWYNSFGMKHGYKIWWMVLGGWGSVNLGHLYTFLEKVT